MEYLKAVSRQMDWSWWSAELAAAVTELHSCKIPCMGLYERKVNRREELRDWIVCAERRMNDPDFLRKVPIILNFKYP
jgi:hypothetical protein